MQKLSLDVCVIGFGKAGKTIAAKRAAAGDKVALVEADAEMYGGTCINIGCVPTKFLLTQAAAGQPYKDAQQARNNFIAKLNSANQAMVEGKGVLLVTGSASFSGPKTIVVGDQLELTADTIIINTGAVSKVTAGGRIHDSTSIQQLTSAPESLAIVGAGPIGLEFATMFKRFGTRVKVYNGAPEFLGQYDSDIAQAVREHLTQQGIEIVDQRVEDPEQLQEELVLMAVGRRPAVAGLQLEAAGIAYTERGITVTEHCETNIPGVYAVGDVTGAPQFTYASYDDHRIVMAHRWGKQERSRKGRVLPSTVFIDPPLATVGSTAKEAAATREIVVRQANIADLAIVPRPKILGQTAGVAKFVVDAASDEILGATLFCVDAQELINMVALAMRHGITAQQLGAGIYTHPATAELFNAVLE